MSLPKVSVICCAYNASQFIDSSLSSIINQTYKNYELIIVNDGSTDDTKEKIKPYTKHQNILFINNDINIGLPKSRNLAISKSSGEFVAIQDADDISMPFRLHKQVEFLEQNHDVSVIGSWALKINEIDDFIGTMHYPPKSTAKGIEYIIKYKLNPIIDPTSMFRKDIFNKLGGYSEEVFLRYAQDFDLWCKMLLHGFKLYNFTDYMIKYRVHSNAVTKTKHKEMRDATDFIWLNFKQHILNQGFDKKQEVF